MKRLSRSNRLVLLAVLLLGGYVAIQELEVARERAPAGDPVTAGSESSEQAAGGDDLIGRAYKNRLSDLQVRLSGRVERLLPDDRKGSRHQRFILRLASGQTLLVAHNIDLAPRVEGLAVGDRVELHGEYEWNEKGGVIHWTHRDPRDRHAHGWIEHRGRRYE